MMNEEEFLTIRVTTNDKEAHTFKRARFLGIWSGQAIISAPADAAKHAANPDAMQEYNNTHISLADVDRLEFEDTRVNLEAAGHLGEDDELAPA